VSVEGGHHAPHAQDYHLGQPGECFIHY
jgi:hypothetical protein